MQNFAKTLQKHAKTCKSFLAGIALKPKEFQRFRPQIRSMLPGDADPMIGDDQGCTGVYRWDRIWEPFWDQKTHRAAATATFSMPDRQKWHPRCSQSQFSDFQCSDSLFDHLHRIKIALPLLKYCTFGFGMPLTLHVWCSGFSTNPAVKCIIPHVEHVAALLVSMPR